MREKTRCTWRCAVVASLLLGTAGAGADEFASDWRRDPDRTWLGPAYHANRWQDWEVRDGRVECIETGKRLAMRTVQVLTDVLAPERGAIQLSVRTGPIDWEAKPGENSWSGLTIGAGGPTIDYRRTAMVHHLPAADGGIVVVVDPAGHVAIRDNEQTVGKTALWSIARDIGVEELKELPGSQVEGEGARIGRDGIELRVDIRPDLEGFTVDARVFDSESTKVLSRAIAMGVPLGKVEGGFGIVSHHGPEQSKRGWWFSDLRASGPGVVHMAGREFGPVLGTLYTVDDGILKLTAQFPPLGEQDQWEATLQVQPEPNAYWETVATEPIDRDSRTATFRLEQWPSDRETPYRVVYALARRDGVGTGHEYAGVIRAEPSAGSPLLLGSLTCHKTYTGGLAWNGNGLWFPHEELVSAVAERDPDMLYFSGDQLYEGDLTPAWARSEDALILDYLWKYTHWLWAFGDITRDRPTIVIPDDHDVYHGNIWGAGGRRARAQDGMTAQDSGGYKHAPRMVNAVHRTQTAHLPDPIDSEPIGEGYSVYYTDMNYGGVSFAIISDRQFKESPTIAVPEGKVKNGWFTAEGFDPARDGDAPDAPLLGQRQEEFLAEWVRDWDHDVWTKVLLSQTPFACVQTLPRGSRGGVQPGLTIFEVGEYAPNDVLVTDADSNGWPQSGRDRALEILQPAQVLHLCGDQHLAFVAQYGTEEHRDGGVVFCTPAIANTWPRRWMPRDEGQPRPLGDHLDGFGNRVSVDAVANPLHRGVEPAALHDRSPGFGMVRFDPSDASIVLEAWPRAVGLDEGVGQYEGWPIEVKVEELAGREWDFQLPIGEHHAGALHPGMRFEVRDAQTGALIRTGRLIGEQQRIWRVPGPGAYEVHWLDDQGDVTDTHRVRAEAVTAPAPSAP